MRESKREKETIACILKYCIGRLTSAPFTQDFMDIYANGPLLHHPASQEDVPQETVAWV